MKQKLIYFLLLFYTLVSVCTIIFLDGTSDAGDSIQHYLFAKYAPWHLELFFDHWAKPLFVLLACPFAQFGFIGIKVFNICVALGTIFFTYRISCLLELKNPLLASIILIFSPLHYIITFSGLTDPLFALFCCISVYLILKQKFLVAAILLSFLPFLRSEGLIVMGVFGFYYLIKQQWKYLPLFIVGHLVYSIAGYFVFQDLLWVFNKIPYARLSSTYRSGTLFHFVEKLIYAVGVPIYALFWIGVIALIIQWFRKKIHLELHILVGLVFFTFFIAHTLFWYLGIFNSMGLIRVMMGVMPFSSIIALIGFNFMIDTVFKEMKLSKQIFQFLIIAYVLVFPFTSNPAAINWNKDMRLSKGQKLALDIAQNLKQSYGKQTCYMFAHPYMSEALQIDCFDPNQHLDFMNNNIERLKSGDIIIWENWFAIIEQGVEKTQLSQNPNLQQLFNRKVVENEREVEFEVYQKR